MKKVFCRAIMNSDDKASRSHALLQATGGNESLATEVILAYGASLQERCPVHMTYYPFDQQTCQLCLGTMASRNSQIIFHTNPEVLDKWLGTKGGSWMMIDSKGVDLNYQDYSNACIEVTLQRRSLYYGINLFFPTITICLLNTVGLFSHLDEPHNQLDIATLGQTTLLSLGVILLTVADQTPKGSSAVSLLGKWLYPNSFPFPF